MNADLYLFIIVVLLFLLTISLALNYSKRSQQRLDDKKIEELKSKAEKADSLMEQYDKKMLEILDREALLSSRIKNNVLSEQANNELIKKLRQEIKELQDTIDTYDFEFKDAVRIYEERIRNLSETNNSKIQELKEKYEKTKILLNNCQLSSLKAQETLQSAYDNLSETHSNTFTYVASLMSDYLTYGIYESELFLSHSNKYHERQRAPKICEIREEVKQIIIPLKEAQYQLDYLLQLYPELNDAIAYEKVDTPTVDELLTNKDIYNDDPVSAYISRDEWNTLSSIERNQLALDRYISRRKSNWEIGRDYELYIAYEFKKRGYTVDTFGSYMKINDLGRDLIAKKGNKTKVIQCKFWSSQKTIHENHICQLFGTSICYCIENNLNISDIEPVFVTSTTLSEQAKIFADILKIAVFENIPQKDFPRIKCNIGHNEFGKTFIYHLPMDQLYDKVQISGTDECYCSTVAEAEKKGFRRAYKWHGS